MKINGLRISSPAYAPAGEGEGGGAGEGEGEAKTEETPEGEGKPEVEGKPGAEGAGEKASVSDKLGEALKEADDASDDDAAGEGKDDEKAGKDGDDDEAKPLELKVPEGLEADEEKLAAFTSKAQELELTQEQAQGVLEYYAETYKAAIEEMFGAFADRINEWSDAVFDDKEIGGEALDENLSVAATAIREFGTKELVALLDPPSKDNPEGLGLGNNPHVVRFFHAVGKAMAEDTLVRGGEGGEKEPLDMVGALYGREAQEKAS